MTPSPHKPLTLHRLRAMHAAGERLVMLTCYDATFAQLLDNAGVDLLLVGDSLGMVLQGRDSTLPVSLIGIGAGSGTAGQVLVLHDMLGLHPGTPARFVRNFMAEGGAVADADAVARYVTAVKDGSFPDPVLHGY